MAYTTIENFKFGIDSRRSEFTSVVGVLQTLNNGHVNQGGEVDKRLAFVPYGNMQTILDSDGFPGTYWLQAVQIAGASKQAVFGSATPSGAANPYGFAVLNTAMPAGIVYYQLKHPAVTGPVLYDKTKHRLVQILCSTVFSGLPWVAAKFVDGSVWCYYNGTIIPSSYVGLVLAGHESNNEVANAIGVGLQAFLGTSFTVSVVGAVVTLTTPAGDVATFDITETSAGGTLTGAIAASSTTGTAGKSASTYFTILAGGAGGSVDSILVPDPANLPNNTVELLPIPVNYSLSVQSTAAVVAQQINLHAVGGYSAKVPSSDQSSVQIFAPTTAGAQVNSLPVIVSFTAPINIGLGSTNMTVTLSKTSMLGSKKVPTSGGIVYAGNTNTLPNQQDTCVATAIGGKAPYKYAWMEGLPGSGINVVASGASAKFNATVTPGQLKSGRFICQVTDSSLTPNIVSAYVDVTIQGLLGI